VAVNEKAREAEIKRGQEIGARVFMQQTFDPTYKPNAGIDPDVRHRRDLYRDQMRRNLEQSEERDGKT
jgi:hypothetical protein